MNFDAKLNVTIKFVKFAKQFAKQLGCHTKAFVTIKYEPTAISYVCRSLKICDLHACSKQLTLKEADL